MPYPTLMCQLLSQDFIFFNEGDIGWDGRHHELLGLQLNAAKVDELMPFVGQAIEDFESPQEVAQYFMAFAQEVEKDDGLCVPRYMVAKGVQRALPEGDLTGLALMNLMACGAAYVVGLQGSDEYSVIYDTRLKRGIPRFFDLVARMVWDLRGCTRSACDRPFTITFAGARNTDADRYFGPVERGVPGAQDDPGTMRVTEKPQICLSSAAEAPSQSAADASVPWSCGIDNPDYTQGSEEFFEDELMLKCRSFPYTIPIEGTHMLGRAERIESVAVGDPLILRADWQNKWFQPCAIEVFNAQGGSLGYLQKQMSITSTGHRWLACLLPHITASVESVTPLSKRSKKAKHALMDVRLELDPDIDPDERRAEFMSGVVREAKVYLNRPVGERGWESRHPGDAAPEGCAAAAASGAPAGEALGERPNAAAPEGADAAALTFDEGLWATGEHVSIPIPDGYEAYYGIEGYEFVVARAGVANPTEFEDFHGGPRFTCLWGGTSPDEGVSDTAELPETSVMSFIATVGSLEQKDVNDFDDLRYFRGAGCVGVVGEVRDTTSNPDAMLIVGCPYGFAGIALALDANDSEAIDKKEALCHIAEHAKLTRQSFGVHLDAFERVCAGPAEAEEFAESVRWLGGAIEEVSERAVTRAFEGLAMKRVALHMVLDSVDDAGNGQFYQSLSEHMERLGGRPDVTFDMDTDCYLAKVRGLSEFAELTLDYARRAVEAYALQAAHITGKQEREAMEDAVFDMLAAFGPQIAVTVKNRRMAARYGNARLPRGFWDVVGRMDELCPGFADRNRALLGNRAVYEGREAFPLLPEGAEVQSAGVETGGAGAPKVQAPTGPAMSDALAAKVKAQAPKAQTAWERRLKTAQQAADERCRRTEKAVEECKRALVAAAEERKRADAAAEKREREEAAEKRERQAAAAEKRRQEAAVAAERKRLEEEAKKRMADSDAAYEEARSDYNKALKLFEQRDEAKKRVEILEAELRGAGIRKLAMGSKKRELELQKAEYQNLSQRCETVRLSECKAACNEALAERDEARAAYAALCDEQARGEGQ